MRFLALNRPSHRERNLRLHFSGVRQEEDRRLKRRIRSYGIEMNLHPKDYSCGKMAFGYLPVDISKVNTISDVSKRSPVLFVTSCGRFLLSAW